MSTLYRDIKAGMTVEYWLNINGKNKTGKKVDGDIPPEDKNYGVGSVLFAGPHFITVQVPSGWKQTISRNDIIDNHAQVRQVAIINRR